MHALYVLGGLCVFTANFAPKPAAGQSTIPARRATFVDTGDLEK
jgi:hypothetical protein